jgi:acetoin utilization deacetylase AcuC-like enzyme
MALVYSSQYDQHHDPLHVENSHRTHAILDSLSKKGFLDKIAVLKPEKASENDILRVHTPQHVNFIKEFCAKGGGYIDYDTYANPSSYDVALLAAGGAITASKTVVNGKNNEKWAYSICRPPGHHANSDNAMGFCLFNNIAVAVQYVREKMGIKRILIFDFDVHFGNGTSEIFYHDPDILYISIHQDPRTIFPGKGFIEELGVGNGIGYTINIPMAPKSNNSDYIWILKEILENIIDEFQPQLLFADAGFDAHHDDPLSSCQVDEDFYSWIGEYLMELQGSLVLFLEGGYNLKALGQSNLALINSLEYGKFSPQNYKSRMEIEKEYLGNEAVSAGTKQLLRKIKKNLSPYFKI